MSNETKISDEDVTRLARRAVAHQEAGIEAVEVSAVALEKLMWELLLLRRDRTRSTAATPTPTLPGTIRAMGKTSGRVMG